MQKKITITQAKKILIKNNKQNKIIKRIQEITDKNERTTIQQNVWIVADSSSNFSKINFKNG
jgi:hypothetical protein